MLYLPLAFRVAKGSEVPSTDPLKHLFPLDSTNRLFMWNISVVWGLIYGNDRLCLWVLSYVVLWWYNTHWDVYCSLLKRNHLHRIFEFLDFDPRPEFHVTEKYSALGTHSIFIFSWREGDNYPFSTPTISLRFTQPLTEMSTSRYFWG
jgi:hypothetical protein